MSSKTDSPSVEDPLEAVDAGSSAGNIRSLGVRLAAAARRAAAAIVASVKGATPWHWALFGIITLYVWAMTSMSLDAHHGLGTSSYDTGIFEQGIWLISQADTPFVTLRGLHLFGDHSSYVLLLLAPIYALFPTSGTLFFAQSAGIALGALPVFLYARRRLGSEPIALLMAAVFLLHPAISWGNMFEFHPDAFLPTFVGFALYGALERRWRVYTVFVVLSLMVKEDMILAILPLGAWVAWRRDRVIGLLTIGWASVFTVFSSVIALQYFNAAAGSFAGRGSRVPFGGLSGLVRTAFTEPGQLFDHLRSERRGWYLWQMSAPFAWVFLRLPEISAIAGLVVVSNLLSLHGYQHRIGFHYQFVVVVVVAMGTVYALGAFRKRRDLAVAAVAVMALWTSLLWSSLPFARNPRAFTEPDHPRAAAAREVVSMVPPDAAVSAYTVLTPHLARRTTLYMFPNPFHTHYYGPEGQAGGLRLPAADSIDMVIVPKSISEEFVESWERERTSFTLMFSNEYWDLWSRNPDG
ncbi:MAG: DUF2079 domain-containing protein [Acidimicrobiia bacterium]